MLIDICLVNMGPLMVNAEYTIFSDLYGYNYLRIMSNTADLLWGNYTVVVNLTN